MNSLNQYCGGIAIMCIKVCRDVTQELRLANIVASHDTKYPRWWEFDGRSALGLYRYNGENAHASCPELLSMLAYAPWYYAEGASSESQWRVSLCSSYSCAGAIVAAARPLGGQLPREVRPYTCLLYTSPSPRDRTRSRMPSSA